MKPSILITALLIFTMSSGFASEGPDSGKASASFKKEFSGATQVNWEKNHDYQLVTFKLNDEFLFAYYSKDGELMALARNILSCKLPLSLDMSLKTNYAGYWITELFEVSMNGLTTYHIILENAEHILKLESVDGGNWEVDSKKVKQ
jgi:hypothetical protein